jgi:L-lactate dehydrogenase complex protein LldG
MAGDTDTDAKAAAKAGVLGSIRKALKRGPVEGEAADALDARIVGRRRNLVPDRTAIDHADQVDLFVRMVEEQAGTVTRVRSPADVPAAVADFLAGHNLPSEIRMAPSAELDAIPWDSRPALEVKRGRAEDPDISSVTPAHAGVAETGTLMLASGADSPTTLNFLPDNHVVVLRASQVVGTYEDGWDRLRDERGVPRTVNFVTGPSRTGDIEQKIQLGAHGPRRLHVVLVEGNDA